MLSLLHCAGFAQAEAERRLASAKRDAPPSGRTPAPKRTRPGFISSDVRWRDLSPTALHFYCHISCRSKAWLFTCMPDSTAPCLMHAARILGSASEHLIQGCCCDTFCAAPTPGNAGGGIPIAVLLILSAG